MSKDLGKTIIACYKCEFFKRCGDNTWGECRANPPVLELRRQEDGSVVNFGWWAEIDQHSWCGKFKFRAGPMKVTQ